MKTRTKIQFRGKEYTLCSDLSVGVDDSGPVCYAFAQDRYGNTRKLVWEDAWEDVALQDDCEIYLISREQILRTEPDCVQAC